MKLGVRTGYFFLAISVLILVLVLFSCGKGKSRSSGAAVTGIRQSEAGARYTQPPPDRELSLAEVIEEVEGYEPPGDVDASIFDELRLELIRAFKELGVERFPDRTVSAEGESLVSISDIFVQPLQDGGNAIRWNEILEGDLNGDGEVTIADVSPIARNYLDVYGDGEGDTEDRFIVLAAGGDDDITIADVAVIARNYLMTGPAGYDVWRVPLAGGPAERIENAGDPDAPTVYSSDAVRTGDAAARFELEGGGSLPSSLRFISQEGEEVTLSNGNYYYTADPRENEGDPPPEEPVGRRFNILVKYDTPFRVSVGEDVQIRVTVFGDVTPEMYAINWGDGNVESVPTNEKQAILIHLYENEGVYAPYVVVAANYEGGGEALVQDAPVIYVRPDFPFAPTGLIVSPLEGGNAYLNWDIIDPNPTESYNVYWSLRRGASRPELLVEGLSGNSFIDEVIAPTIAPGIFVYYKVTAVRGGNESPFSNEVGWPDIVIPPPTIFVTSSDDEQITSSWTEVPDTAQYDVLGYRVYKAGEPGLNPGDPGVEMVNDPDPLVPNAYTYNPVLEEELLYFFAATVATTGESVPSNNVSWERSTVEGRPVAVANPETAGGLPPLEVNFSAEGSYDPDGGEIAEYAWKYFDEDDYHDRTPENGSAIYIYSDPGTYFAWLRVTDDEGDRNYDSVEITVYEEPVAVAGADPLAGLPPLEVSFSAVGSSDPDGDIVKWEWDFDGDEVYDWESLESGGTLHTYDAGGVYTAVLKVTDDHDLTATDDVTVLVYTPPVAVANAVPGSGLKPLTVNFNANGSTDPDGDIIKWEWDFTDDGTYDWEGLINGNALYEYVNHGNYTAKLRIRDNDGATDTDTVAIHVNAAPVASLTADPTEGDAPLTVSFNASSSNDPFGNIAKYEWDWDGDGTYDFDSATNPKPPPYTYNTPGTYNATVKVTDNDGAWDTASVEITVHVWIIETVDSDGNVGADTSIALDSSDNPHISYFDDTNDDLMYAYYNGATWQIENVDSGDVGGFSSIAVDSSDNPHISYRDYANADLKYAYYDGTSWQIETVDGGGDVGKWSSIELDSSGNPSISYWQVVGYDLKYAYYNGASWEIETVDSAGDVGQFSSLALDPEDNPHISYRDGKGDVASLKYAYFNGASWLVETVDSWGGSYTSIALDSSDLPHISYTRFIGASYKLNYAYYDGSSWQIETVDSEGEVDYGRTSIALDSSDNPHISYYDWTSAYLKHAYNNGTSWEIEIVDNDLGTWGGCTSIAVDSSDYPHISYMDNADGDLKYAYWK